MAEENIVQQSIYRAVVEPSFAKNVFSQLTFNDDTFGDYKDVAIAVRNHYRKYDTPMSGAALVNDLARKAKTQRKFNDDTQSKIEDEVAEVTTLSKTENYSNDQEIKDQVDKWSRNVVATGVLMKAISNGSRDIGSDDTLEELLDGLNKALTIGSTSTDAETISLLDPSSVDDVLDLLSEVKQDTVPLHWEALDDLMDGGMAAGEMGMVVAKSGSGKSVPIDTPVYTPNGVIKNGDLKLGDYVYNRLGKPVEVKGIYDKGELEEYKVTTDDGRVIYCNDGHLFSYWSISGQGKLGLVTKTLREMIDLGLSKPNSTRGKMYKYSIPVSSALEFPEQDLPVEPYTLGALIGDGSLVGKCLYISACDDKLPILDRIVKENNWTGYKRNSEKWYTYTFCNNNNNNNPNRRIIYTSDLDFPKEVLHHAKNKHIPEKYKIGSKKQRLALLQGLFDTDGSVSTRKGSNTIRVNFSSTSAKLIEDMVYILRSLGYKATATVRQRNRRNKAGELVTPEWNLNVNGTLDMLKELFSAPYELAKFEGVKAKTTYHDRARIVSAEPTGRKVPMRCIYVDDPEHLYVAGDFIVTHNTTALVNMAKQYAVKANKNVMYIALEERTQRMILRLFRLISNQSQRDIYDEDGVPNVVKLKAQMNALSQAHEQGKIGNIDIVKSTPQTVTPKMIEQFLQEYMLKHGYYPDVIFLDYPDLMLNPHDGQVNEYRGMGMLYEDLRKIAGQYNLIMWVASQANRSAGYEEIVDSSRTIEGSKQKLNTVEVALSINQTDEEFQAGFIRLHVDKVRNPKDGTYNKMIYFKVNTKAVSFEDESPSDFEAHQQVLASSKDDKFGEYKKPSNAKSNEEARKKIADVNSKIVNIM